MINVAILGAGNIARVMAKTVNELEKANLYGIASRELNKAEEFAKEFGIANAYGSYEEMVKDPSIDLVYIASPHSHHYEHVLLCLNHGKHVLCEKAFTANARQAKEVLKLAKDKKLLITEAIWPRYMPIAKTIQQLINDNRIGEVHSLTATFGAPISHIKRLSQPEFAGGALLDLGVYTLTFASIAFGKDVTDINSAAVLNEHGVDAQHSITLKFADGKIATLLNSMLDVMDSKAVIYGSKGYMVIKNMSNYEWIKLYNQSDEMIEMISRPDQITGYEYEVLAAIHAIQKGELECEDMPHEETIRIMEMMDGLRASWGVSYPFD